MANTLPLDPTRWDLKLDTQGNLTLSEPAISIAQDVASAIRTFLGECWYNTALGLPYFGTILGKLPPSSLLTSKIQSAAFSVPGVLTAKVVGLGLTKARVLAGTVVLTSTATTTPLAVGF